MGWKVAPKRYVYVLAPRPVNMTLFGKRVFANVTKKRILRDDAGVPRLILNPGISICIKKEKTQTQKERPCEDKVMQPQEMPTTPGSWKRQGRALS